MTKYWRWLLLLLCLLTLGIPALAQEDDEDDGVTLDAGMQWRIACAMWDRREYDDAASLMVAFAERNPDNDNVLEALWRSYEIYRAYRPNPTRKKAVWEKALNACERWVKKYADDNKVRAARSRWYKAQLLDREGNRAMAIVALNELVTKFPGSDLDDDAYWALGEWLREAGRTREAIDCYAGYIKTVGVTDWAAVCWYREAMCFETLGDREGAVDAYKAVLNGGYNWQWHYTAHGGMDAARRLRALGEEELARAFALRIVDSAHPSWVDLRAQALAFLGEKSIIPKYVRIYPHLNETYTSYAQNITGGSKLQVARDLPVLVRLERVSKEDPFTGSVVLTPKMTLAKAPDNMKLSEENGVKFYTAPIAAPDARGGITGDWWYNFTAEEESVEPPDSLTITRAWEQTEPNVGLCSITIKSSARWHIWIYLPNNKTNVNNVNVQPHEVQDGGKTFKWHDWFDLSKGMTLKFPVEVGGNAGDYFPKIRLEHSLWGYQGEASGNNNTAITDTRFMHVKLMSEKSFPYTFHYAGTRVVVLNEMTK